MEQPLVSVIIPAHNAERFLAEAIESTLSQTYGPIELIVVDDGSTDATAEIAAGYPEVELLSQEQAGPAAARNSGFAASNGAMVSFHDADDVMLPEKLELQVGYLLAHPEVGCVLCEQEVMYEPGAKLPFWVEGSPAAAAMPQRPPGLEDEPTVQAMTMVLRRETFERVGPFDESMRSAEDLDWLLRAVDLGVEIARLPTVVFKRRIHASNLTHDIEAARAGLLLALRARIARHRARADAT